MSVLKGPAKGIFDGEPFSREDMLALDRLAAAAWPGTVEENLDGWTLRAADGISRRANSVAPWPLEQAARPMEQMLKTAQVFYEERGLPPRFQISPAAEPDALDEILMSNGYEIEAPVTMMIASVDQVRGTAAPSTNGIDVTGSGSGPWWTLYQHGFGRDVKAITDQAREQPLFATAPGNNGAARAIGFGVAAGGWVGVFGLFTAEHARGNGLATQIIAAVADEAARDGAYGVYLQVEKHNSAARRLFSSLGFRPVYGYYYRTLWPQSD